MSIEKVRLYKELAGIFSCEVFGCFLVYVFISFLFLYPVSIHSETGWCTERLLTVNEGNLYVWLLYCFIMTDTSFAAIFKSGVREFVSIIRVNSTDFKRWVNLMNKHYLFCLFVLGFNVSLALFQSYCDGTCMRQVRVQPHWNAPVAGTWQEHPTESHYKLTPGRPAIFPSTHLSMPSVSKGATNTIFQGKK